MNRVTSAGGGLPPALSAQDALRLVTRYPPVLQALLAQQIEVHRARLADLEARMIATCEVAAFGGDMTTGADDYQRRSRAAWRRYLAVATRLEGFYGLPIRRLRRDIERLQRLRTLLAAI